MKKLIVKTPKVSLITVNYNGLKYLDDFFTSVVRQDYPAERLEVIMVDNGSTDKSVEYLKSKFPDVKILQANKNLGFGGGNNLGMKHATGDLFFLLNNDTILYPNTVRNAVTSYTKLSKNYKVGALNCKLLLFDKYLHLTIKDASFLSYKIFNHEVKNPRPFVTTYKENNSHFEDVLLPVNGSSVKPINVDLKLKKKSRSTISIKIGEKSISKTIASETSSFKLSLPFQESYVLDLFQNAGNFYFRDGHGRDRGVKVQAGRQFYEIDNGQYKDLEEIPGFCGAASLLNRKAIAEVGNFDKDFFFYYEDGDLSFRMKKAGWKIFFSSTAVVRHIHSASSEEWSDFFIRNAERGRLLFLIKNWPRMLVLFQLMKYVYREFLFVPIYYLMKGKSVEAKRKFSIRLRVLTSIAKPLILSFLSQPRISYRQVKDLL